MANPGLYTACITPFTHNGDIDYENFARLVQRQVDANVRGIVVMGTTGESPTIRDQERKLLIQEAKKIAPSSLLVMAGCGTNDTFSSIKQAQAAESAGADALQIPPPPYNKPSQEGLFEHYKAIHDAVSTPFFVYNVPGRTGVNIEPATTNRILQLERCIGTKEASGNLIQLMEVLEFTQKMQKPITVLSGDDILASASIALGAHGVMSVISNLIPKTTNTLLTSALNGDKEKTITHHYRLKRLMQACFIESNPIPIKYMMAKYGLCQESYRLPLVALSQKHKQIINDLLSEILLEEVHSET